MSGNLKKVHWTKDAACKFDKNFTSFHIETVNECKKICGTCSVQVECILANAENDGSFVSAGLSKYDRLVLQWKRVDDVNESVFRDSSVYVSNVVRRVRKAIYS